MLSRDKYMTTREKKLFRPAVVLLMSAAIVLTIVSVRAGTAVFDWVKPTTSSMSPSASSPPSDIAKTRGEGRSRLAGQPAAFKLAMKLGKRFRGSGRVETILLGTLRTDAGEQRVRIMRRQTDDGERVEIALDNGPASLTWSATEGAQTSGSPASKSDSQLIERLVLDSPDQFILAQLRGAAYQTINRNVRPASAGSDYSGPVWNIIEVKEPAAGADAKSAWRLYWINSSTGMIDKIVSREDGADVIATLSGWMEQRGESLPSRITWTRGNETLMQLDFDGFNYSDQQSQQQ